MVPGPYWINIDQCTWKKFEEQENKFNHMWLVRNHFILSSVIILPVSCPALDSLQAPRTVTGREKPPRVCCLCSASVVHGFAWCNTKEHFPMILLNRGFMIFLFLLMPLTKWQLQRHNLKNPDGRGRPFISSVFDRTVLHHAEMVSLATVMLCY